MKTEIIGLEHEEIRSIMEQMGEPGYRADQVMKWIYGSGAFEWDRMTNIPKGLRASLDQRFSVTIPGLVKTRVSQRDSTSKLLLRLVDGETIETVIIPEGKRLTVCVSSQIGCGMGCSFCATGMGGLVRNLKAGEIVGQVLRARQVAGRLPTNIVMMGMGEPLANYDNVLKAVRILNHPLGLNIGIRKTTISTCGLVPGIRRLAGEGLQVVLAVSLHAADDRKRDQIMPVNRIYPLGQLIPACRDYVAVTGRRITFEYALMAGFNDSSEDATQLAALLSGVLCHVNLIPVNPVEDSPYARPEYDTVLMFQSRLSSAGIEATVRAERGSDIEAACGQLRAQYSKSGVARRPGG